MTRLEWHVYIIIIIIFIVVVFSFLFVAAVSAVDAVNISGSHAVHWV